MANQTVLRISREITQIQKGTDLSIAVACQDSDVRSVRALIVGPPGTPYQYGFFEFSVRFGSEYPSKPPKVEAKTTNRGKCRFNPNIYAEGKVCLSILGTWQGEKPGEEWSSAQGLESILWSIQSLMSNNPYENEPGYENAKTETDKKANEAYCAKIRHETLRIAVISRLEGILGIQADGSVEKRSESPRWEGGSDEDAEDSDKEDKPPKFEPFNDLLKRRFLWYYESYISLIETEAPKHSDHNKFELMPFEGGRNSMEGEFQYANLGKRLIRIKEVLAEELEGWARDGLLCKSREGIVAYSLQSQFDQIAGFQKQRNIHNVDISLENNNPFVWIMTYFGRSGTHMDGGIFRIKISLSPKFPDEQPRVKMETRIFHHRVSKNGVICYSPKQVDEMKYHIESIVQTLEEECPPYDPRTIVHPEATRMFWGTVDEKKKYGRLQRRSAQESMEEAGM